MFPVIPLAALAVGVGLGSRLRSEDTDILKSVMRGDEDAVRRLLLEAPNLVNQKDQVNFFSKGQLR